VRNRRALIAAGAVVALVVAGLAVWVVRRGADVELARSDVASPSGAPTSEPEPGSGSAEAVNGSPSTSPRSASAPAAGGTWWRPKVGMTWQWQLSGALDRTVAVQV
jgi:hypothetical protein